MNKKEFKIGTPLEPKESFFNFDVSVGFILKIALIVSVIGMIDRLITHDAAIWSSIIMTAIYLIWLVVHMIRIKHGHDEIGVGIRFTTWR